MRAGRVKQNKAKLHRSEGNCRVRWVLSQRMIKLLIIATLKHLKNLNLRELRRSGLSCLFVSVPTNTFVPMDKVSVNFTLKGTLHSVNLLVIESTIQPVKMVICLL